MIRSRIRPWLVPLALLAVVTTTRRQVGADDTTPPAEPIHALVAELDAGEFYVRESAMRRLRTRVLDAGSGARVAEDLDRLSLEPSRSFEAHQRISEILRGIDRSSEAPRETLTDDQTQAIVAQLCDDRFNARENASRRLQWLLGNPGNIVPLMGLLKTRLNDSELSLATRQDLDRHYAEVRRAWLLAPAEKCPLPAVTDEQIAGWVRLLARPTEKETIFAAQRMARCELEDALVRDECRERTANAIADQLSQSDDAAGAARLRELVDLAKPAMVAEIWSATRFVNWVGGVFVADPDPRSVHLVTTQYLHVGVPQIPEGAPRATHFDRCGDTTAHCVSGNTLLPGDYPVGTAFSHPQGESTLFHLINLPTPRRRLIYEYSARRGEAVRLCELSQRTCDAFLAKERMLTESDAGVLMLLDRVVVSQFAGQFFARIDDEPLNGIGNRLLIGHTSRHGAVCYALAFTGTKEAAPGLIRAIAEKRFLPENESGPYNVPMIALLAIAARDPWERVDDWLEKQLDLDELLVSNVDPAPELAATAAAILGDRLGQSAALLGLAPIADSFCQQVGFTAYRFENEARRVKARQLLRAQRQKSPAP